MRVLSTAAGLLAGLPASVAISADSHSPCLPFVTAAMSEQGVSSLRGVAQELVENGAFPGIVLLLAQHGKVLAFNAYGKQDLSPPGRAMRSDTIFEVASMTKPVVSVAMMILFQEGKWTPQDPISKYIPEFSHLKVYKGTASNGRVVLEAPLHPPTMGELLSNTAGFTYGAFGATPVDRLYQKAELFHQGSLKGMIDKLAGLPLLYQPGTRWVYSISADIEGYLVQVLSGESLPAFLKHRIFTPLGMRDTDFYVPDTKRDRLVIPYGTDSHGHLEAQTGQWRLANHEPSFPSGGSGLFSTAGDYYRFAQMLLNGGDLDGVRILSPASIQLMTSNHLSAATARRKWLPTEPGIGYGYGFGVYSNPALAGSPVGPGTYFWGGLYGTLFWIDPSNDLTFVAMVQRSYFTRVPGHGWEHDLDAPNLLGLLQDTVYGGMVPIGPARCPTVSLAAHGT